METENILIAGAFGTGILGLAAATYFLYNKNQAQGLLPTYTPPPATAPDFGPAIDAVTEDRGGQIAIRPAISSSAKGGFNSAKAGQQVKLEGWVTSATISQMEASAIVRQIENIEAAGGGSPTEITLRIALFESLRLGGWKYTRMHRMLSKLNEDAGLNGIFTIQQAFRASASPDKVSYILIGKSGYLLPSMGTIRLGAVQANFSGYPELGFNDHQILLGLNNTYNYVR